MTDYGELTSLPSRQVTGVIECFGNPLAPDVPTRRVGNVVWHGVALADVLALRELPVREQDVNSIIVRPAEGTVLTRSRHVISGWAWGAWDVARVGVSIDRGATWRHAQVEPRQLSHSWQRFTLDWPVDAPGAYQIACRATDVRGRVQPSEGRNCVHAVSVAVT